jgi:hypothetical protein
LGFALERHAKISNRTAKPQVLKGGGGFLVKVGNLCVFSTSRKKQNVSGARTWGGRLNYKFAPASNRELDFSPVCRHCARTVALTDEEATRTWGQGKVWAFN